MLLSPHVITYTHIWPEWRHSQKRKNCIWSGKSVQLQCSVYFWLWFLKTRNWCSSYIMKSLHTVRVCIRLYSEKKKNLQLNQAISNSSTHMKIQRIFKYIPPPLKIPVAGQTKTTTGCSIQPSWPTVCTVVRTIAVLTILDIRIAAAIGPPVLEQPMKTLNSTILGSLQCTIVQPKDVVNLTAFKMLSKVPSSPELNHVCPRQLQCNPIYTTRWISDTRMNLVKGD